MSPSTINVEPADISVYLQSTQPQYHATPLFRLPLLAWHQPTSAVNSPSSIESLRSYQMSVQHHLLLVATCPYYVHIV